MNLVSLYEENLEAPWQLRNSEISKDECFSVYRVLFWGMQTCCLYDKLWFNLNPIAESLTEIENEKTVWHKPHKATIVTFVSGRNTAKLRLDLF